MSQPPQAPPISNAPNEIPKTKTSSLAIVSLVLGIASFIGSLLVGIPAIILGLIARSKISQSDGNLKGSGLATGGIVTGVIGSLVTVLVMALVIPMVRNAHNEVITKNNIRQIGLGCHWHQDRLNRFPSNVSKQTPEGGLSWRVHLLPALNYNNVYYLFHLDEPWDSPHNKTLIQAMPECFKHPVLQSSLPEGHTVFQMPTSGPDDAVRAIHVEGETGISVTKIADGSTNTILVVETNAQSAVPWTKPADWRFDANNPKQNLGDTFSGKTAVGLADGSVHMLETKNMSDENLRNMICPNDGNVVIFPK